MQAFVPIDRSFCKLAIARSKCVRRQAKRLMKLPFKYVNRTASPDEQSLNGLSAARFFLRVLKPTLPSFWMPTASMREILTLR